MVSTLFPLVYGTVFVFLLVVLMISENFLTQSLTGKNTALDNLREKLQSLELSAKDSSEKNKNLSNLLFELNKELENISKNEAKTILFAFIIQLIIFFSSQYFEFSIGQINEKKNLKK